MNICEIVWLDSSTTHGWTHDRAAPLKVKQVGYLVEETDGYYVLADSRVIEYKPVRGVELSELGCNTAIPKSAVLSYRDIEVEPRSDD